MKQFAVPHGMSGYLKSKTIFFFLLILMLSLNTSFLPKPTPWLIFNADPSVIFYPFDDAKVLLFAHTAKHFVHFSFILASFLIYLKEASRIAICPLTPASPLRRLSAHHMPPHPASPGGRGATKKRRHNVTSLPFFMNCGGECHNNREDLPSQSWRISCSPDEVCARSHRHATSPCCAWPPVPSPNQHGSRVLSWSRWRSVPRCPSGQRDRATP